MRRLGNWLIAAAVIWPAILASGLVARLDGQGSLAGTWATVVYLAASLVCHQLPARSFHTAGVAWPVCGRCAGLYLAAPLGAIAAWWWRPGFSEDHQLRAGMVVAAVPTAATLALEWGGLAPVGNLARALAAAPLGGAIAFALVRVASNRRPIDQVN